MSADDLRKAAETLRGLAQAATVAPWEYEGGPDGDGLVWADRLGDPVSGSTLTEDASYIATMHPGVGLALADWLDQAAIHVEAGSLRSHPLSARALTLARLINGGAA